MCVFVWSAALCSMYDYLRGTASFLSFILGQQSKTVCVSVCVGSVYSACTCAGGLGGRQAEQEGDLREMF